MMQTKQFWQEYRHWLLEICRERININPDRVTANSIRVAKLLLDGIELHGYCSNKAMAVIIRNNQANIRTLIPEGNETQIAKLNQAIEEAKKY